MKWLINEAFLTPFVDQLLGRQIDSWTSKIVRTVNVRWTHSRRFFKVFFYSGNKNENFVYESGII